MGESNLTHGSALLSCSPTANDYGLFLSDEDPKKGIWLEAGKALDYYMLRNGVSGARRFEGIECVCACACVCVCVCV